MSYLAKKHGISAGKAHWNRGTHGAKARKLSSYELGWLTALIDGEGSVFNSKKSTGGFSPRLQIGMTNLEILTELVHVTGCGTISKGGIPKKDNHTQSYYWRCDGANAVSLIEQCLPGLIVKRERAISLIAQYTITIDPS